MDRKPRVYRLILLIAAMAAGCEKSLPSAPSEVLSGVTLYEHANFLGRSAHLMSDVRDLENFDGPCEHTTTDATGTSTITNWNDCVSSIRVAPGWRVEAYRDDGFRGQSISSGEDIPNLQLVAGTCSRGGLNDCITSVRVLAPR